jgi:PPOX class probable F420-dependent enzyme
MEALMSTGTDEGVPIPQHVVELFDGQLRIGHMSTVRPDGQPSVVPVGVMIHDGKLRISSRTATRKISNLERDPHISLCVTDPDDANHYVTVRGTAEISDDIDRVFVSWLARTFMGCPDLPHEKPTVARTVITIRPLRFVIRTRAENEPEQRWSV